MLLRQHYNNDGLAFLVLHLELAYMECSHTGNRISNATDVCIFLGVLYIFTEKNWNLKLSHAIPVSQSTMANEIICADINYHFFTVDLLICLPCILPCAKFFLACASAVFLPY